MLRQGRRAVAVAGVFSRVISVVKLGGSLLNTDKLQLCLVAAAKMPGRVVVVPGGGSFADLVRREQQRWHFDDLAAHRMAILAMQQMALLCHSLMPTLVWCRQSESIQQLSGHVLWAPDWLELDAAGIAPSWDITSDSLAAWLAGRIGAHSLWLIKATEFQPGAALDQLQRQGIVDAAFLRFADPDRYSIKVINQDRFLTAP